MDCTSGRGQNLRCLYRKGNAMKAKFHFTFEKQWHTAPMAYWVHIPVPGEPGVYDPPAPVAIPHRGYVVLRIQFDSHELQFSSMAQLDHFMDVLSRKPLPTSRQLSVQRGRPVGPNSHWLSRLPANVKSPRRRALLLKALHTIREQIASLWKNPPCITNPTTR